MKLSIHLSAEDSLIKKENIQNEDERDLIITGQLNKESLDYLKLITGRNGWIETLDISGVDNIERLDANNFDASLTLTKISLPKSLKEIGWGLLNNCSKLSNITIPSGVEVIDNYAFNGLHSLTDISLPSSLKHLGEYSFGDCDKLQAFKIPSNSKNYAVSDGVVFSKYGDILVKYPSGKTEPESYTIPEHCIAIGENAFFMNEHLTEIKCPPTLTEVGKSAFKSCTALMSIDFSTTLKKLPLSAFNNCTSLQNITISAPTPPELVIDENVQYHTNIYVPIDSAEKYRGDKNWNKLGYIYGR